MDKIKNIEEAAAMIPDGSTLAIGGLSMNSSPMALIREIIRQEKKDLKVVAIVNGMAVDWLIAAGCVDRLITGLISFEGLGLSQPDTYKRTASLSRRRTAIELI